MSGTVRNIRVLFAALLLLLGAGGVAAIPADAAAQKCMGRTVTHTGTPGDDVLRGTPGNDVFLAGRGNDQIHGLGGNDRICAGPGDDVVKGGAGRDRIKGGSGNDEIHGGKGRDRIIGGGGSDILVGNAGRDFINGGRGVDSCLGATDPVDCEPSPSSDVVAMVARINTVRAAVGQPALKHNPALSEVATAWSQHMADTGTFEHNPNYWAQYPDGFFTGGENIALNLNAVDAQSALEASAGHYRNMTSANYTDVGIGIVTKNGRVYVTQNFGGRR